MNLTNLLGTIMAFLMLTTSKPQIAISTPSAPHILAEKEYSLTDRYSNQFVNDVFADNILLTLSYMNGQTKQGEKVDWNKIHQPNEYEFLLQPGKTFAFHDQVEDQYKGALALTTNAHFNSTEGFKSDGWLVGDGVCHLASFMNVVAQQAGLRVDAPTRHDFAKIPDVSREFGTAIYYMPGEKGVSSRQNLYVTNTTSKTIAFVFNHTTANSLQIAVEQLD